MNAMGNERPSLLPRRRAYRDSLRRADYFVMRNFGKFMLRELRSSVRPGVKVADVGCGEQPLRRTIEDLGGLYTGIDVTQNAQRSVDIVADISALPVRASTFDVVLCSDVLEHLRTPTQALAELSRVLRAGGSLVLSVPFAYPLHEVPHDYLRFTPYWFAMWAEPNGFTVARSERLGHELEVLSTVWGHLWTAAPTAGLARKALASLLQLPVGVLVAMLSPVVGKIAPRRYFLTLGCVLRKSDGTGESTDPARAGARGDAARRRRRAATG